MRHLSLLVPFVALLTAFAGCSKPKPPAPAPAPTRTESPAEATTTDTPPADAMPEEPTTEPDTPADAAPAPADTTPADEAPADTTPADAAPADAAPADAAGIEALLETLSTTEDRATRVVTIDAIAALGQRGRAACPALEQATGAADAETRWHAARAIGLMGEDAIESLPRLVALLADEDPIVAAQAAAAIGMIRRDDDQTSETPEQEAALYAAAVEPLMQAAAHGDPRVRRAAIRTLRHLSPAPGAFLALLSERLGDSDPSVIMPVLHTLASMNDEAVPALVAALDNPASRYWAEVALAEMGPKAADAAAKLSGLVAEGDLHEQLQAILALAAIGEAAQDSAPNLLVVLESGDASLHLPVVYALGSIRAAGADAALERIAAEDPNFLGAIAAWARARLHSDDAGLAGVAIERLQQQLTSEDVEERSGAVAALAGLAAGADDATKAALAARFAKLLSDPEPAVRLGSGAALVGLGAAAVDVLRGALADAAVRPAAIELLGALGPAAEPAVGDLIGVLDDRAIPPQERAEAAVALGALGEKAAPAVPALLKQFANVEAEPFAAYAATYALGRIGPAARETALEPLHKAIDSDDDLLATVAIWATLKLDPEDRSHVERAVPLLAESLKGGSELARLEAALTLAEIGADAAAALPILELVAEEDAAADVRRAAAAAVAAIRATP